MFEVISIHEGKKEGLEIADRIGIVLLCSTDNVSSDMGKVTCERPICAKCTTKDGNVLYAIFTPFSWDVLGWDVLDCTAGQVDGKMPVVFRTKCVNWSITPDKTDDTKTETDCDIDEAVRLLTQP